MRQVIGWLILILSFFVLGFFLNQYFSKSSQSLSPIPDSDEVRVIMLTPVKQN